MTTNNSPARDIELAEQQDLPPVDEAAEAAELAAQQESLSRTATALRDAAEMWQQRGDDLHRIARDMHFTPKTAASVEEWFEGRPVVDRSEVEPHKAALAAEANRAYSFAGHFRRALAELDRRAHAGTPGNTQPRQPGQCTCQPMAALAGHSMSALTGTHTAGCLHRDANRRGEGSGDAEPGVRVRGSDRSPRRGPPGRAGRRARRCQNRDGVSE